jgi:hypothetical protein
MVKRQVRKWYPRRLAQAHWRDYFDDSFDPDDALLEDLSYTDCD